MKIIKISGQSLIELLVAMALSAILLPALLTGMVASREGKVQQNERIKATGLAVEAAEAIRIIRESGWNAVSTNGTYHPVISGNTWTLANGTENIAGFERKIVISDVLRDPLSTPPGKIVLQNGTIDPSTKKIDITVSWGSFFPSSVTQTHYISRYLQNSVYKETLQADFLKGTGTKYEVTNTSGGEIVLGAGGWGNWCKPALTMTSLDLPKNGVANAISAIKGRVFAGTGDNASGESYATVDIDNGKPPHATVSATFDGYKTNGIFGEQNYAYLATDTNGKQGVIINVSSYNPVTKKYSEAGSLDAGTGSVKGASIYVANNIAYLSTSNSKIFAYDIVSRSGSHSSISSVDIAGEAKKIIVVGNNIYAAINSKTTQLQIIPLLNNGRSFGTPVSIAVDGQYGRDLYVKGDGTRVYLAVSASSNQREFFIIDTDPFSAYYKITKGAYDTGGMDPKGVTVVATVVTEDKAIIVGTGGIEYQVINIADEANPSSCGNGLDVDTGINGVASVKEDDGDAYSYVITGDVSTELKIILGGAGGQYALSGEYTSAASDSGQVVVYNRIKADVKKPENTNISMQVATADAVSGSCINADYVFVGPNGTQSDYYLPDVNNIIQAAVPLNDDGAGFENPARCMKYRLYMSTSNKDATPILYEFKINMSL